MAATMNSVNGLLDVDSVVDLFCLDFVYQPKINEALKSFMDGWNNHEHNMTPVQLFARGVLVHNVDLADLVDDGTFSIGNLESPAVTVPVINNPLTARLYPCQPS